MKNMEIKKKLILLILMSVSVMGARAQSVGVKTNLLGAATLNANAGIEIGLAPRWTLDVTGQYNAWPVEGHKWKHWLAQPEARYWFCDRFAGHFVGVHALGGQYNVGNLGDMHGLGIKYGGIDFGRLSENRAQGWAVGAGVSYGYAWILGKHWNLEAELGVGYVYTRYDVYECVDCGRLTESGLTRNYVGPTKAAINLVYVF